MEGWCKVKTFWGDNNDDLAVDRATPHIITMLALAQKVLEIGGNTTNGELSVALNFIDVEQRLIDALAAMRNYQKEREKEMEEGENSDG